MIIKGKIKLVALKLFCGVYVRARIYRRPISKFRRIVCIIAFSEQFKKTVITKKKEKKKKEKKRRRNKKKKDTLLQHVQWQTACMVVKYFSSLFTCTTAGGTTDLVTSASSLRKHAYSNKLKISPPKTESFQIKNLIFFIYLLKT